MDAYDPLPIGHPHFTPEALSVPPDYAPRRRSDVLELDMGDGSILYNHDSSLVHHLNPSAAVVWQLCDGRATVAALSADIAGEYRLPLKQVQAEVAGLVAELDALGLVEDAAAPARDGNGLRPTG